MISLLVNLLGKLINYLMLPYLQNDLYIYKNKLTFSEVNTG